LEDLNQRLVVLTMGEQRNAMENDGCGGGGGGGIDNEPIIVTREEFKEYGGSMGGVGGAGDRSQGGEGGVGFFPFNQRSVVNDTKKYVDGMTSASQNKQRDELPICEVVSPSDLPGGYMFEAQLGTKKFLATVPPGGVVKDQRFVSTMRELENIQISVPLGSWRNFVMECFSDGIFHPLFCNTLFFPCSKLFFVFDRSPPRKIYTTLISLTALFLFIITTLISVAVGQIMTRTSLDWRGEPANRLVSSLSCANMTVLLSFWLAMNASLFIMLRVAWQRGYPTSARSFLPLILFNGFIWLYMITLTAKVRGSIRNKYQIPEETCVGSEDCVCATFCMPCAICQMGRHTADFDTYRATFCTSTGLPAHVELAPVTFYQDQYQNMNDESQGPAV
jgi:Cys-rich protein (TIGR01571 family)